MKSQRKTISQMLPDFETREEALERQEEMIQALKGGGTAARESAEKMTRCADGEQCNLAVCPLCVRSLRRTFILGAVTCVEGLGLRQELPITEFSGVSVIGNRGPWAANGFFDLRLINELIRVQHKAAGFPLAFAGIEFSFNEDGPANDLPIWQAQVCGIVAGLDVDSVETAIKRVYQHPKGSIPMPSCVRECAVLPEALSYVMKPNFFGRVCYMDGIGRQTAKWDQKMGNVLAVARRLARYELPDRYILTSCGFDGARFILNRGVRKCLKELALDLNHGSI